MATKMELQTRLQQALEGAMERAAPVVERGRIVLQQLVQKKVELQGTCPWLDVDQLLVAVAVCLGFFVLELFLRVGPLGKGIRKFSEAFEDGNEGKKKKAERLRKGIILRLISSTHNLVAVTLALYCLQQQELALERMKAHTLWSTRMVTFTCGYFMHDLLTCLMDFSSWGGGYLLHALSCFTVFFLGSNQGTLHFYGACFLLWELSTPFVHVRWLLKSIGKERTLLYTVNGLLMMAVFFLCRNVFGVIASCLFWMDSEKELVAEDPQFSPQFLWAFRVCNVVLNLLNLFWFCKMVVGALALLFQRPSKRKTD